MIKQSLGLIETVGLSAAIEAADTAVKSANVTLIGYELTKGGGLVVVKLMGEVGAVNAAIDAAKVAAAKVNQVFATKIIARMGDGLEDMLSDHNKYQSTNQTEIIDSVTKTVKQATINSIATPSHNDQVIKVTTSLSATDDQINNTGCLAMLNIEPVTTVQPKKNPLKSDKKIIKKNSKSK